MDPLEDGASTFLKADEVDEAGPGQVGLDLSQQQETLQDTKTPLDTVEQEDIGPQSPREGSQEDGTGQSVRPKLKRDKWAPAPQQPPPPAPPKTTDEPESSQDSLSLMQLKRLVTDMPRSEPTPYAFQYEDMSSFEDELEELFGYSAGERQALVGAHETFTTRWQEHVQTDPASDDPQPWNESSLEHRRAFLKDLKADLRSNSEDRKKSSLDSLAYLALGCWCETACPPSRSHAENVSKSTQSRSTKESRKLAKESQVSAIHDNVNLIQQNVGVEPIFRATQDLCMDDESESEDQLDESPIEKRGRRTVWPGLVLLYLFVELEKRKEIDAEGARGQSKIVDIAPNLLHFLTEMLAKIRWEDSTFESPYKILILYWKTLLLLFGGSREINDIKNSLDDGLLKRRADSDGEPIITASPLDYHMFRQEITSKYPAFDPPPPLFPFQPENSSIVPPLHETAEKEGSAGPANITTQGSSIIHQPVHIATPAPSPPPSPAGAGGKGIKKQNYQTNQMFPFLYPPLDESSNDIGGKGATQIQDLLVGRNWQGGDVPVSILEAGHLFASRMRASRAMKQLWDERVRFLKFERGHVTDEYLNSGKRDKHGLDGGKTYAEEDTSKLSSDLKQRLQAVENFYADALPRLQSLVIVLLKVLLQTVTTLVTQPQVPMGAVNGFSSGEHHNQNRDGYDGSKNDQASSETLLLNVDLIRSQEIMGKAVSGIIILLLKWFKLSHILKFEYFTQLLLDSNYVQLILKLFTHQELERVVNYKCERKSLNFFNLCHTQATRGQPPSSDGEGSSSANEDASPDQAQGHSRPRGDTGGTDDSDASAASEDSSPRKSAPPEVNELGFPTGELPRTPITSFSWRNFYSNINHLRVLQKIVKGKAHRQLLMVQYKYSTILKKSLKVPQPDIRQYTLKIIKGQVPYCHRKWRQSNMRIITAIYLHCKPELRDEWLAGVDVDYEMGEALPQEQALRSLTYWHNLRKYPVAMEVEGAAKGAHEADVDSEDEANADSENGASGTRDGKNGNANGSDGDSDDAEVDAVARKARSHKKKKKGLGLEDEEQDFFKRELALMEAAVAEQRRHTIAAAAASAAIQINSGDDAYGGGGQENMMIWSEPVQASAGSGGAGPGANGSRDERLESLQRMQGW